MAASLSRPAVPGGSALSAFQITPSDSEQLPAGIRAMLVTETGDVVFIAVNSASAVTLPNVPAYTLIPVAPQLVLEDTTATVVALGD